MITAWTVAEYLQHRMPSSREREALEQLEALHSDPESLQLLSGPCGPCAWQVCDLSESALGAGESVADAVASAIDALATADYPRDVVDRAREWLNESGSDQPLLDVIAELSAIDAAADLAGAS